jgi:hypothetical protein
VRHILQTERELRQMLHAPGEERFECGHQLPAHAGTKKSAFVIRPVLTPSDPLLLQVLLEDFLSRSQERTVSFTIPDEDPAAVSARRAGEETPKNGLGQVVGMMGGEDQRFQASRLFPEGFVSKSASGSFPLARLEPRDPAGHAERFRETRDEARVGVALSSSPAVVEVNPTHFSRAHDPPPVARDEMSERNRVAATGNGDQDIRI